MKNQIKKTIVFAVILLLIDIPWISTVMKPLYKNVFTININKSAALIAYLVMVITYPFLIEPKQTLQQQLLNASILGLAIYGTYGFTLAAIYNKYPMKLALTETIWGISLFVMSTFLTNKITKLFI